jgi:phage terminase small subunit
LPDDLVGFDEDGQPIYDESARLYNFFSLKNSDEIDGSILTEVKEGKEGITLKLADKMKALEVLTKYFDMLSNSDKERLQQEKMKAEIEHTKERTKLIKGEKKDTSLLESFLEGQKQFDKAAAAGTFKEYEKGDPDGS